MSEWLRQNLPFGPYRSTQALTNCVQCRRAFFDFSGGLRASLVTQLGEPFRNGRTQTWYSASVPTNLSLAFQL